MFNLPDRLNKFGKNRSLHIKILKVMSKKFYNNKCCFCVREHLNMGSGLLPEFVFIPRLYCRPIVRITDITTDKIILPTQ